MQQPVNNQSPASAEAHEPQGTAPSGAKVSVRPVQHADAESIHQLLLNNLPNVLADRERWMRRWAWQYWNNPYRQDRSAGWVLVEDNSIVGHLGAVYLPVRIGKTRTTGMIGADYVVAEDSTARHGLFGGLELAKSFFENANDCIAMATTANEKTGAIFGRFGCKPIEWTSEFWRAPANIKQQIRSCRGANSRTIRRLLSGRTGVIVSGLLGWSYKRLNHTPAIPIPADCQLETTVPQLARDIGSLYKRAETATHLTIDRSQVYLDWRYANHPERENIRVLVVRDRDGVPIGEAFVFIEDHSSPCLAHIEEMVTIKGRPDVMRTLLCAALKLACDHQADYLVTMTGRRAIRHLFWELGFEDRARSAPAAVIQQSPKIQNTDSPPTIPNPLEDYLDFWHGGMF